MKSLLAAALLIALPATASAEPNWPVFELTDEHRAIGAEAAANYDFDASRRSQQYTAGNNYLNYGTTMSFGESDRLKRDDLGIPMIKYGDDFYYNPVTTANFALHRHGAFLAGRAPLSDFIVAADKILETQQENGGWRFEYPYRHYTQRQTAQPGDIASMGVGLALSVFARAYQETNDQKYIEAGNRALAFMMTPFPKGPMTTMVHLDPSLTDYIFFLEYPTNPHVYTLNGYMFVLLGLYDWWQIAGSDVSKTTFAKGIDTLENILPYYDLGNFSTYDLSYITYGFLQPYLDPMMPHVSASYHHVHIYQLRALGSATGNARLSEYAEKWQGYVE